MMEAGTLAMEACDVIFNDGGTSIIFASNSMISINNCYFYFNNARGSAVIEAADSDFAISNTVFENNQPTSIRSNCVVGDCSFQATYSNFTSSDSQFARGNFFFI